MADNKKVQLSKDMNEDQLEQVSGGATDDLEAMIDQVAARRRLETEDPNRRRVCDGSRII